MFRLIRYLKGYEKESIIGPLFKLLEACFELVVPLIMAAIIDVGIHNRDTGYILRMGGLLVLMGVLGLSCSITAQYFAAKAAFGFGTALRRDMFQHINRLSYAELDSIGASTLVTRVTGDINQAQSGVNLVLRLFLRSPFIVAGALVLSFVIDARLGLIFLVVTPVMALVIFGIMRITMPIYKLAQKQLDRVLLLTRENLSGVRVIRAFSRQQEELDRFAEANSALRSTQLRVGGISALLNPLTYVLVNLGILVLLQQGAVAVDGGRISQGDLVALVNYMNQILLALVALANLIVSFTKALASGNRINEILDTQPSFTDEKATRSRPVEGAPRVEFRDVSFGYGGSSALSHISFKAWPGQTIGIIGGTGAGKSSLVHLIPRFYEASEGQVLVDGIDVKDQPFHQLRHHIGIVPQRAVLFRGTIRSNLRWRDEQAGDEELWRALRIAQASEFVEQKPHKLDTTITQAGKNLSGGQRQRLTIARALVGNPDIVILDDSASALDYATDARLRHALATELAGCTVFVVSQRAASIKHADLILVLDDGQLAGAGTHSQLLKSCPVYREICLSQLSKEEVEAE